ncbi:Peptide deformylase-like protein [Gluconacetobacter sp. SXCC-1]|uniref:Peptide deformylase-like n=1 Tax=Komagataeibacter rhaeticus TaxID=215221 RepID=A0A181CDX4_9PROT|nr:peptide deformylase [Komagataeibacter rhaeticus]ATU71540.1 peptide deformylase [Komagataeibacter xylinus]EGG78135.1 Peptide deformylase-like protein [Gluconacetobacter sp. SXCC-1]QIP36406.1 peptide deformylase [Komagataeibacter rhaeticus]QOC46174.1 peptide deformylase [Komagataeibacter rhaeticus]WPP21211.1 peptide deformylase [Komagataeibacter rhaeticus]
MAILPIIRFPHACLQQAAAPVDATSARTTELARDLLETMHAAPGIGITACHVGMLLRLVVIDLPGGNGPQARANPEIIWQDTATATAEEGSVSMPGIHAPVTRPARVRVRYTGLDGLMVEEEAEGLLAACLQHEIDQINGIFWTRRLSPLRRDRAMKRYSRQTRLNGAGPDVS